MDSVPFFPDRASTMAGQVDNLYFAWLVLSGVVALAVAVLMVWFAIRYRQGSAAKRTLADAAEREKKMHRIEIIWTVVPLALFIAMFVWSARVYYQSVTVPKDALPIYVVAKQWMWHAEHPGGEREIDELHVPAKRPGEYHLFCTQYCRAARGAQRYRQLGCSGCHGAQATVHAPRLEGLFGRPVQLHDGRFVLADERFIRDAVLLPTQDVPAGYEANMPSYRGQIGEEELLEIIEYIKSLGNATQEVAP
jgi:cytochrome c oxidase subunit 2